MEETTQDAVPEDTPQAATPTSYGYCSWHQRFAADVRLINVIEQGSGPGGAHYACASCRELHNLVPYADRP